MDATALGQVDALCASLYNAQDPLQRQQAEQVLRAFTTNTEYIPQCKAILDASASPYAQHFAASSLTRLVTENALTPQLRLDVRHYVLQLLAARGVTLEAFVATALIQLLVRVTKIGWFEADAQQALVKDTLTFLSQPSPGVVLLGLRILDALVVEMNTPSAGGYSVITQRKTAVSFRDTALLSVFTAALTSLRQLRGEEAGGGPQPVPTGAESERLTDAACGLALRALSFDFVGTSLDESAEELGTIQVPSSWRSQLEDPRTMALLLSTYAASSPPLSCTCLEVLVRLASVRRSLFTSEPERASFLARLLRGTADILRSRAGLQEHANYHEFCRLLGRLKTNYQLSELVSVEGWREWISLVADFTLTSLASWQWASGSVYYLLSLWARLVASVPYLKGEAPSLLETYVPRITEKYITTRLEAVAAVAAAGGLEDPLEMEEQLSEQLESLPALCRFQYEHTCGYLCTLLDPLLGRYGVYGDPSGVGPGPSLAVVEGQLTWLVYVVGAVIRGRLASAAAESQEGLDGELALRVFQLLRLMQRPGHAGRAAEPRQRLELAVLGFFQNFRKVYVGEQAMHTSRVYLPLAERLGLTDHLAVLNACVSKIWENLDGFAACPPVVEASLALLSDLAAGYMSGKLLLKLDAVSFALSHHTETRFPFLREPANARSRTLFYATLGRLLFCEDAPARFKAFIAPFDALCCSLAAAAAAPDGGLAFRSPQSRALVVGLFRDLRGLVSATATRRSYGALFDWLHPAHTPLLHASMSAFGDDPGVAVPLLKLASELAHNKTTRCTWDSSSVSGILLFRELSRLVCAYARRVLVQPRGPQPYERQYKGVAAALQLLSRALAGGYVNFGVFELYGDPALKGAPRDALDCAFAMAVSVPPADVLAFRKLGRAYFAFLEALAANQVRTIVCTDDATFGHIAACLEAGLKSLDVGISSQCASAVDALAGFYFAHLPISEASPPAAQQAARHLAARPNLFPELLRALFEVVLFEDCANLWSLSRPMLSLILVSESIFNELKAQLVATQPADRRDRLAALFDRLMTDVTRSLDAKNRDKFTQNLGTFRTELHARPATAAAAAATLATS